MLRTLLSALAFAQVKHKAERAIRNLLLTVAIAAVGAVAAAFLLAAAFLALLEVMHPIWACLLVAGVFLLIALALWIGKLLGERSRRRPSTGSAAMMGALGGGTAAMAVAPDTPPPAGPKPTGGLFATLKQNRMVLVLPVVAFAAAVLAGRYGGPADKE